MMENDLKPIDAYEVKKLIKERLYSDTRNYAVVEEVYQGTGGMGRRLDMIACDCYRSHGFALHGIEIKISKGDFRNEFKDSTKHSSWYELLDTFSIACPADACTLKLVPDNWGIYLVDEYEGENGWFRNLRVYRKPLSLHDGPRQEMPRDFFASLIRASVNHSEVNRIKSDAYWEGYEKGKDEGFSSSGVKRLKDSYDHLNERLEGYRELEKLLRENDLYGSPASFVAAIKDARRQRGSLDELKRKVEISARMSRSYADDIEAALSDYLRETGGE